VGGETVGRSDENLERRILQLYDQVAFEYDNERDLWSNHYYNSTDEFLRIVLTTRPPKKVLDVGVGSGRHIVLYAAHGAEVSGIDTSRNMLRVASYKSVQEHALTHLVRANAQRLPFEDEAFDFVACCGSVLNYCPSPESAIAELSRVLMKRGTLVVGFDNSLSLDYLWVAADSITGHRLGYGIGISEASHWISDNAPFTLYPYFTGEGQLQRTPQRHLRFRRIAAALVKEGISIEHTYGIHILSSLVPFTITSNPRSRSALLGLANRLCALDEVMRRFGGLNKLAYHIIVQGTKT
jgi:SAM-dependent methyltransferase